MKIIKYIIVDKPLHTKRSDCYRDALKSLKNKNFKEIYDDYDNYNLLFYFLVAPPVNFGKYTIYPSPLKYIIQNNKNAYIGTTPIDNVVGDKSYINLNKLDFYPKSYNNKINKIEYDYYIIKPNNTWGGKNISIVHKKDLKKEYKNHIIQRYIKNPFLLDGHKFDFRVYVLWIDNKVYVNKNFYTRLAYKKYDYNNPTNLEAGLTNLLQHKILKYLVRGDEFLKRYNKEYPDDNANFKNLEDKIQKLVKEYFVFVKKSINKYLDFWNDKKNHYFNLFGFDILPDENGKLYLLEVNISPGFNDTRKNSLIPIVLEDMIKIILKQKQKSFVKVL